jgi:hypothetical protein
VTHAPRALAAALLLGCAGCATDAGVFYWGQYEESLYVRQREGSDAGQAQALLMLERTIAQAEKEGRRPGPGVYADYGYLLYRRGRPAEAAGYFRKEADAYPEARPFMEAVMARVGDRRAP